MATWRTELQLFLFVTALFRVLFDTFLFHSETRFRNSKLVRKITVCHHTEDVSEPL